MKHSATVIWGKVRRGNQRGRILGYPTINIRLHKQIPHGVYLSVAKIRQQLHPALTFIGSAKTFDLTEVKSETYILDYNTVLYDTWVSLRLLKKIRNNKKFANAHQLQKAIAQDEKIARAFFKNNELY